MKTEILRKDFFTVLTAEKIIINFKEEQILTFNILVPSPDRKIQVKKNLKKSNRVINKLMRGESGFVSAQNRVNSLIQKPRYQGDGYDGCQNI